MNPWFSELYDAYMRQIQLAKRKNEDTPNLLWSIKPEHLRVLLNDAGSIQYMDYRPMRTIFGVPFIENGDQLSTWALYILADKQA